MKLRTWKEEISPDAADPVYLKAIYDARGWWNATVEEGPWYGDSDPEAHGHTEQEAKDNVIARLREMRQEIDDFLKEVK